VCVCVYAAFAHITLKLIKIQILSFLRLKLKKKKNRIFLFCFQSISLLNKRNWISKKKEENINERTNKTIYIHKERKRA